MNKTQLIDAIAEKADHPFLPPRSDSLKISPSNVD